MSRILIQRAADALEEFSGHPAKHLDRLTVPDLREVWLLGKLHYLGYGAKRDGRVRTFEHQFEPHARPHIVVSSDGHQIGIIGGRFQVTARGFTDI